MATFSEIVLIAFITQLAVLPGEKVQLIIATLSTRYHPLLVVGAAGSAFAGWTALEILFGRALQAVLPGIALDLITAVLFLLFAVLLVRSAPGGPGTKTDGGHPGELNFPTEYSFLNRLFGRRGGRFLSIFALMAAGEFGDKTQLVTIGLAAQYGATAAIWVGEMLAIIPISLLNAYFFARFSERINMRTAHLVGAALFVFFGVDVLLSATVGISIWETAVETISNTVISSLP